ncbi:MAG TPA: hypothetical protein VL742_01495 [Casimicrobiaceae bacterium]|nr:hypothetical protein [Casimicrobiaceae bacterium]
MRRLTSVEILLIVFWVGYAILAAGVLYASTPPVSRVLLLILGGYSVAIAPVIFIVLWDAGVIPRKKRSA